MFDIGWQELFLVAVVALIIVGPKDLPRALRAVTGALRKVKGMARDFQSGLDDIVRESDLQEMRKQIEGGAGADFRKSIEDSIDPDGEVVRDLHDMRDFEGDLTKAAQGYGDDVKKTGTENSTAAASGTPPETDDAPARETAAAGTGRGDASPLEDKRVNESAPDKSGDKTGKG